MVVCQPGRQGRCSPHAAPAVESGDGRLEGKPRPCGSHQLCPARFGVRPRFRVYLNTTKGFRDCVKNAEIDSFQISVGLGHRAVTCSLPALVLVVSYYLLSRQNSVYPRAPPTTPSPACLPWASPNQWNFSLDTAVNWGHWATTQYNSLLLAQETPRNGTTPVHQCQTNQRTPSPSAPWKVKVTVVAWDYWPQPAPCF